MKQEIEIPEGHEAKIVGNKVVFEKKESGDEIHRKWILEYLYDGLRKADEQFKDHFKAAIDWLEKRKAQKPLSTEETELNSIAFLEQLGYTCVPPGAEQKPILEVFGFKVGDAVRLKDGDGRKHIIKSFEEVEGLHGLKFYHVKFEDNSARDNIYPGKEYPNGYYTQMEKFEDEQKPAELPKSEDYVIDGLYVAVDILQKTLGEVDGYQTDDGILEHKCAISAVKELYEQKPTEWSEEDKENIEVIATHLDNLGNTAMAEILRNLRPQSKQEWSEEDEQFLLVCKNALQKYQSSDKWDAAIIYNWLEKRLKSLRPQPHWKPSDAQIQACEFVLEYHVFADPKNKEHINSLCNDLKNL